MNRHISEFGTGGGPRQATYECRVATSGILEKEVGLSILVSIGLSIETREGKRSYPCI